MADIALAAGVSRQTLYKEFGSREEFAQVLLMREADRFLDVGGAAPSTANVEDPAAALAAAFDVFLTAAAENPLVRAIVHGEGAEELLALFTTQGKPIVEGMRRAPQRGHARGLAGGGRLPDAEAPQRVPRAPGDQLRRPAHRAGQHDRRLGRRAARPYIQQQLDYGCRG